jgi:hypothetical protein
MIALALISMLSCTSNELATESVREGARLVAPSRSRDDASFSVVLVVEATRGLPNAMVRGALKETTAIWRAAGVAIEWHLSNSSSIASDASTVRVILDDARGTVSGHDLPLGWINFNSAGIPEGIVHLSRANVFRLIDATAAYRNRPTSYQELLAARALGRALAHELGHYLTGSKVHSPAGLMKGRRLADELFSPTRTGFTLTVDERQLAAKTLTLRLPNADL